MRVAGAPANRSWSWWPGDIPPQQDRYPRGVRERHHPACAVGGVDKPVCCTSSHRPRSGRGHHRIDDFDRIHRRVPSGQRQDHRALPGGVPLVRRGRPGGVSRCRTSCTWTLTVTEARPWKTWPRSSAARSSSRRGFPGQRQGGGGGDHPAAARPLRSRGGVAVLRGNLAPGGAVIKHFSSAAGNARARRPAASSTPRPSGRGADQSDDQAGRRGGHPLRRARANGMPEMYYATAIIARQQGTERHLRRGHRWALLRRHQGGRRRPRHTRSPGRWTYRPAGGRRPDRDQRPAAPAGVGGDGRRAHKFLSAVDSLLAGPPVAGRAPRPATSGASCPSTGASPPPARPRGPIWPESLSACLRGGPFDHYCRSSAHPAYRPASLFGADLALYLSRIGTTSVQYERGSSDTSRWLRSPTSSRGKSRPCEVYAWLRAGHRQRRP